MAGTFLCSGHKCISSFGMNGFEDFQEQPGTYQVVAVDLAHWLAEDGYDFAVQMR